MRPIPLLLLACVMSGCTGGPDTAADVRFLRDPMSGMCLPIARDASGAPRFASWAGCDDPCAALDQAACVVDPRCVPRYSSPCPSGAYCATLARYDGCDPRPQDDACLGLDAATCSATPGCAPRYGGGCGPSAPPAMPCHGDADCAAPQRCVIYDCLPAPCPPGQTCTTVCGGVCERPDEPPVATCYGNDQCAPGDHCSTADGVCLPPPGCSGDGVACPAVCAGTCVPDDGTASCFAIADEQACVARADCAPVLVGSDCSCDPSGCSCQRYDFIGCRPAAPSCGDDLTGAWSTGDGGVERHLTLTPDLHFTVDDLVAPCPRDAVCVWSGIVENAGSWALAGATLRLSWNPPLHTWEGLSYPQELKLDGCGPDARLVDPATGRVFARLR